MIKVSPKTPTMRVFVTVDFRDDLAAGATISSINTSTVAVYYGTGDDTPSAILDGAADWSGTIAGQWIIDGVVGVEYAITLEIVASNGEILAQTVRLPVQAYI